ncbi:hypothetical protein DFH28DRAFT_967240 [Melampsora americana]|nr:hypothetical protein DFH28DRAFT_967240 [Melampsora americana]
MVDPSSPHSSSFLSNSIPTQSTPNSHQPSSLLSATTQLSSNSSNSFKTQPRSTTPSRFLNSGSPLPPTSAYALVSSTRSLETPTSDIRATSPTAQLGSSSSNQDQEHHHSHLNPNWSHPRNSTLSSTAHFDFCHPSAPPPQALIDLHHGSSRPFIPSGIVKPSSSIYVNPPTPTQNNPQLDCFWAILDRELKFIYVDPKLQRELEGHSDQILSTSIYNYIHPADLDSVMSELDSEGSLPSSGYESNQLRTQDPRLMQSSPTLTSSDPMPLNQHRVIECCRFARSTHLRRLLKREEGYLGSEDGDNDHTPFQIFLNPIGDTHLLCFFHGKDTREMTTQSQHIESLPSWPPPPRSHSSCGLIEPSPSSFYFPPEESRKLESAMVQSSSQTQGKTMSSTDRSSFKQPQKGLDVFQILDSGTGAVLFSYPPPSVSTSDGWSGSYRPEDYACLAINAKKPSETDEPAKTTCSTKYQTQRNFVKDGSLVPVNQSFVINYGSITFASFRSGVPTIQTAPVPPTRSPIMPPNKPPPIEIIHDSLQPVSLDIHPAQPSTVHHRAPKRPRTDSYPDIMTPQSATSGSGQISPMVQNLPTIPDSPDPYGSSQYTHFSGELSPTMASAADVLGSFHRAHYHHPQSMLAFQDLHRSNPSGPSLETHPLSPFDTSFSLQGLANMAAGNYAHHRAASDFSAASASSSPRPGESFAAAVAMVISPTTPTYDMRRRAHGHSASVSRVRVNVQSSPAPVAMLNHQVSTDGQSSQVPRSCSSCGAQNSPEWRKGPNGVKSLCNACGLRFSRAQARKSKLSRSTHANSGAKKGESQEKKKAKKMMNSSSTGIKEEQHGSSSNLLQEPEGFYSLQSLQQVTSESGYPSSTYAAV